MTLKQNLIDRSAEIKFLLEKELRALDAPCSLADMTRRVGSSRLPIEKHLANLLQLPEFADLSLVKIGTYDVLYRKVIDNRAHEHLKAKLGISLGETTADQRFTLLPASCLGVCEQAPAMLIDGDVHGDLTPQKVDEILVRYE